MASNPVEWILYVEKALGILRAARDLLPRPADREALQQALRQAEEELAIAKSQAAQSLGYDLCRCAYPPGISMRQPDGSHRCEKCGRNTDEDYSSRCGGAY
jgi:hypothetical protein